MNVALPAVVLFIILLPGFIFRSGIRFVEHGTVDYSPFGDVVIEAVSWVLLLHSIWLALAYIIFGRHVDPVVLMNLLSSSPAGQANATQRVGAEFSWIAAYFVSLLGASHVLPALVRHAVVKYGLHRMDRRLGAFFRFQNAPWYYLLTGADFAEDAEPDFIVVSAIVEVAKEAMLYVGILDEFYFDSDGELDRLILQQVTCTPWSKVKPAEQSAVEQGEDRSYPMAGDHVVLRYSEIITLNIQYAKVEAIPNGGPVPAAQV